MASKSEDAPLGVDGREGELERIVRLFNIYEVSNFERYLDPDGFCWWDGVRFSLIHALCTEQGLYGSGGITVNALTGRISSAARQIWNMQSEFSAFLAMPHKRFASLYISNRALPYVKASLARESDPTMLIGNVERLQARHAITKQSVDFAIRMLTPRMKPSPDIATAARTIARDLGEIFETKLDIETMVLASYRKTMASRQVWTRLLGHMPNLERVVFVNDDTLKFATHLANMRGIDTEEVQHGYMGSSHGSFTYPPLEQLPATMPQRCIITRNTGDIVYPVPLRHVPDPLPIAALKPLPDRPYDIVIGASPKQVQETNAVIGALAPHGCKVAVRLHPAQSEASFLEALPAELRAIDIVDPTLSFFESAAQARIFIPISAFSTTGFEAADAGCDVVLVRQGAHKASNLLDRVASAEAHSCDELLSIVAETIALQANKLAGGRQIS